jgi:hypothetical protein
MIADSQTTTTTTKFIVVFAGTSFVAFVNEIVLKIINNNNCSFQGQTTTVKGPMEKRLNAKISPLSISSYFNTPIWFHSWWRSVLLHFQSSDRMMEKFSNLNFSPFEPPHTFLSIQNIVFLTEKAMSHRIQLPQHLPPAETKLMYLDKNQANPISLWEGFSWSNRNTNDIFSKTWRVEDWEKVPWVLMEKK